MSEVPVTVDLLKFAVRGGDKEAFWKLLSLAEDRRRPELARWLADQAQFSADCVWKFREEAARSLQLYLERKASSSTPQEPKRDLSPIGARVKRDGRRPWCMECLHDGAIHRGNNHWTCNKCHRPHPRARSFRTDKGFVVDVSHEDGGVTLEVFHEGHRPAGTLVALDRRQAVSIGVYMMAEPGTVAGDGGDSDG